MNLFIKKVSVFFCAFALAIVALNVFLSWRLDKNKYYALPKQKSVLLLGNSQPEHAINDSMIPELSNLAQSGEAYFYTFVKLKRILRANPQIRTVFLGISNNSIEKRMSEWISDDNYMSYRYPKYASAMSLDELWYLAERNPECFAESQIKTIKSNFNSIKQLKGEKTFISASKWGGYKYQVNDNMDSLLTDHKKNKTSRRLDTELDGDNIEHARDIVDYCKRIGVQIIFIRFPVHPYYASLANEHQFVGVLRTRFRDVRFVDFRGYPMLTHDFTDFGHLNYRGARKFTKVFRAFVSSLKDDKKPEAVLKSRLI